jgi:lysozyme
MSAGPTRYPVAIAFSLALAGGLLSFTVGHEGAGPAAPVVQEPARQEAISVQREALRADPEGFVAFVKAVEPPRVQAYPDPGYGWAVPTICYGHTRGVKRGMVATLEQCELWLKEDYSTLVLPVMQRLIEAPLAKNEAIALADFIFNVGSGNFAKSTLLKKLNAGDYAGAAEEFLRWNKSNGKVLPGLVTRRQDERNLFIKGES